MPKHMKKFNSIIPIISSVLIMSCAAAPVAGILANLTVNVGIASAPIGLTYATEGFKKSHRDMEWKKGMTRDEVIKEAGGKPRHTFPIGEYREALVFDAASIFSKIAIMNNKEYEIHYTLQTKDLTNYNPKSLAERISRFYDPQWHAHPKKSIIPETLLEDLIIK